MRPLNKSPNSRRKQNVPTKRGHESKRNQAADSESEDQADEDIYSGTRSRTRSSATNEKQHSRSKSVPNPARRKKAGPPSLLEIIKLQSTSNLQIPMLPFSRLIREILQQVSCEDFRLTPTAIDALRESCEAHIVQVLSDAYLITLNRKQVTLQPRDLHLLLLLRGSK